MPLRSIKVTAVRLQRDQTQINFVSKHKLARKLSNINPQNVIEFYTFRQYLSIEQINQIKINQMEKPNGARRSFPAEIFPKSMESVIFGMHSMISDFWGVFPEHFHKLWRVLIENFPNFLNLLNYMELGNNSKPFIQGLMKAIWSYLFVSKAFIGLITLRRELLGAFWLNWVWKLNLCWFYCSIILKLTFLKLLRI